MFDAFKIGVSVHLRNHARAGLDSLAGQFRKTSSEATRLTRQIETLELMMGAGLVGNTRGMAQLTVLNSQLASATRQADLLGARLSRIKAVAAGGAVAAGVGMFGLYGFGRMMRASEGYQEAKTQAITLGWTDRERREAAEAAWENAASLPTATVAGGMRDLMEMTAVTGSLEHAKELLPMVTKVQAIGVGTEWGGGANLKNVARDMMKALDMLGKTKTPEMLSVAANKMTQALIWSKGMVNFETYRFIGKYSRQAKYGLSEEFLFNRLPKLAVDYASARGGGGGHGGVGAPLAAFFRFAVQGVMNKEAARALQKIGLVERGTIGQTTTTGVTAKRGMVGRELAIEDPFAYVHSVVVPAMMKHHAQGRQFEDITPSEWTSWLSQYFRGNNLAADLVSTMIIQKEQFNRDTRNTGRAMRIHEAYSTMLTGSPAVVRMALRGQFENLMTAMAEPFFEPLIRGALHVTHMLQGLMDLSHRFPRVTTAVTSSLLAVVSSLTLIGVAALAFAGVQALAGTTLISGALGALALTLGLPIWGTMAVVVGSIAAFGALLGLAVTTKRKPAEEVPFSGRELGLFRLGEMFGLPMPSPSPSGLVGPPTADGFLHGKKIVLEVDGRVLGRVATESAGQEFDGPSPGTSDFDPTMSIPATGQIGGY